MAIKNIICQGIGFSPGSTKFIPTHGFTPGAALVYTAYGATLLAADSVPRFFEVWMRAASGTAYARLYDVTSAAAVSGSELSTTSATMARVRTATRVPITSGNEYRAEFSATDGYKQGAHGLY